MRPWLVGNNNLLRYPEVTGVPSGPAGCQFEKGLFCPLNPLVGFALKSLYYACSSFALPYLPETARMVAVVALKYEQDGGEVSFPGNHWKKTRLRKFLKLPKSFYCLKKNLTGFIGRLTNRIE